MHHFTRRVFPWGLMLAIALAPGVRAETESGVQAACKALALNYGWFRDHPQGNEAAYANLFTADAALILPFGTYRGRDEIGARLVAAQQQPPTVHLMSNFRIEQTAPDRATGTSYAKIYVLPPGDEPVSVDGYAAVGEYHDEYQLTADGWRIARREFIQRLTDSAFRAPTP